MIGKIQTLLLALTLVVVVWIGVTYQRQQSPIGKYSFVLDGSNWIVFNTTTGELSTLITDKGVPQFVEVNHSAHTMQQRAVSLWTDPTITEAEKMLQERAKKSSE